MEKSMRRWAILVNNGYAFEYDCEISAPTAKAAREIFLKMEDGSHKGHAKKIRATEIKKKD